MTLGLPLDNPLKVGRLRDIRPNHRHKSIEVAQFGKLGDRAGPRAKFSR